MFCYDRETPSLEVRTKILTEQYIWALRETLF